VTRGDDRRAEGDASLQEHWRIATLSRGGHERPQGQKPAPEGWRRAFDTLSQVTGEMLLVSAVASHAPEVSREGTDARARASSLDGQGPWTLTNDLVGANHGLMTRVVDHRSEEWRRAKQRLTARREFGTHLLVYVVVNAALIGIWALTGGEYFWPAWILGCWAIGLVLHAWDTYVDHSISDDDVEAELRRQDGR
jgi:hypothetical protein